MKTWEHLNVIKALEYIAALACDDSCAGEECQICPQTNDAEHDAFIMAVGWAKVALSKVN